MIGDAAGEDVLNLRRFCTCIIEFLSGQAIDPHLYFQQKMNGEVARTRSIDELIELMRRLIGWVDGMDFSASQIDRLDAMLSAQGLPPLSDMRGVDDEKVVDRLTGNG